MTLEFGSLEKAFSSFQAVLAKSQDEFFMGTLDEVARCAIRSGVIQHFEFTFELCWKFIQRWLLENRPSADASLPRTRKDLFRMAARHGLIDDPEPWFDFGDARNITSHTYDEAKAEIVYAAATRFAPEAALLLERLEANND